MKLFGGTKKPKHAGGAPQPPHASSAPESIQEGYLGPELRPDLRVPPGKNAEPDTKIWPAPDAPSSPESVPDGRSVPDGQSVPDGRSLQDGQSLSDGQEELSKLEDLPRRDGRLGVPRDETRVIPVLGEAPVPTPRTAPRESKRSADGERRAPETPRRKGNARRRAWTIPTWGKIAIVVASVLAILSVLLYLWLISSQKPPLTTQSLNTLIPSGGGLNDPSSGSGAQSGGDGGAAPGADEPDSGDDAGGGDSAVLRDETMYTFLLAGKDKVGRNTDAIMVACFDAEDYTLNVISIPRDTYVNVSLDNHRINALYAYGGVEGLMSGITNLIGYRPDGYAIVDLDAFVTLVDAVGGVDYYVPRQIDYDDDAQDLHIHFTKGQTHMTGQKAMEYIRFRKGYADADIGRIDAQHDFLLTAAEQILENREDVPVSTVLEIFANDVATNLDLGQCTWLAGELMKMDPKNIRFFTMPGNYADAVGDAGFVTVYLEPWLKMLNEYLNPFSQQITEANVDIATRDEKGRLYATGGKLK